MGTIDKVVVKKIDNDFSSSLDGYDVYLVGDGFTQGERHFHVKTIDEVKAFMAGICIGTNKAISFEVTSP